MPIEKLENGPWIHAGRLPLGGGWSGRCCAQGHQDEVPSADELREFCNLGYAERCSRLPQDRDWDSVRFGGRTVDAALANGKLVRIRYICERKHLPVEHGVLEFDSIGMRCNHPHRDQRVQKLAECFLQSYLEKRKGQDTLHATAS